jgi:hypothetical protein
MQRPYDPYAGSSDLVENPFPGVTEEYGGKVQEQVEMARRALEYKSRFETTLPPAGDVSRGSGV